jgi:GT2 family glycosyltransferase
MLVTMPHHDVRPVTIVIPIYAHLPSLLECLESVRRNVDLSVHRVLLINDDGREADTIEARLLELIADEPSIDYVRNPKNLGFVGTCNRAVLELDNTDNDILLLNSDTVTTPGFLEELSGVLHTSPLHAAVCPRSNNATIASLPFKLRDPSVGRRASRTAEVHAELRDSLPRFSIAPVAMGFCILIRRELIREHGLFDTVFSPGYGEENDFCLRVGQKGFVSVIAHRALVFHASGVSFSGPRRDALRSSHEKILVARYPTYPATVRSYINKERDPVDVFADALLPGDDTVRVLIDIEWDARDYLTSWRRELLQATATASYRGNATFTVSVPDAIATRVASSFPGLAVVRQSRLDGQWDVAFSYSPVVSPRQLARLNRSSLRLVFGNASHESAGFADHVIDMDTTPPAEVVRELVEAWGRSNIDVSALRERWAALTLDPDYTSGASAPLDSRRVSLLRRMERVSPQTVGWARWAVRRMRDNASSST